MQNVVLVIHLLLALTLIGVVLMQRSEGGGLGMGGGGGGGGGGLVSARGAATALGKLTWLLAVAFIGTSITLTILAARDAAESSVVDGAAPAEASEDGTTAPTMDGDALLPPSSGGSDGGTGDAPLVPDAN
ncbi:MAG: preprotein translocase subunit SecG [Salibaculum sp.]|jgi:preprotein translocase subunit SecG|uniref:preprotein translocase subunit SecG n=1 Tax=Roseovarius halophilus (ex Wu et al. 2025) TaxID=3376060 RepID=UPI002870AB06|nr:preprotein translocase subunit SecG [Salibaculum sp.]MDR9427247.1 preprotein translocase subunit SecG [Salibaculum sp.]MDR9482679.1 preprotein translocase subunit SecG [Salibaculum sp.]